MKIRILLIIALTGNIAFAQITERERPKEWSQLVKGARFMDRFLPMQGNVLSSDTWGAGCVVPRLIDNGIEDRIWSYWGGNIHKGKDEKYHLFVCGWLENSTRGHMEWSNSFVFNTVSDNIPKLKPYEKTNLKLPVKNVLEEGAEYNLTVTILDGKKVLSTLNLTRKIEIK